MIFELWTEREIGFTTLYLRTNDVVTHCAFDDTEINDKQALQDALTASFSALLRAI